MIILIFAAFAYLFYHDGTEGYREKNEHRLFYELFTKVAVDDADSIETASEWREYASQQKVETPEEEKCPLPVDFDREQMWPAILAESFDELKTGVNDPRGVWETYTEEKKWNVKPVEKYYDQGKLTEQLVMASISLGLVLIVSGLFIRTLLRTMEVTEEAYIAPGRKVIPYTSMKRIDTRKWDSKGIALIEYEANGTMKKAKIDGMIYGQFKKEDGQPAARLYEFVMERFKGEIIEFEAVKEAEEPSEEDSSSENEDENSKLEENSWLPSEPLLSIYMNKLIKVNEF